MASFSRFGFRRFWYWHTEFVAMGLIQEIARGVGVSVTQVGHMISAYALGVVVGAPLIAVLSAKVPRKGLLLILMLFLHWAICDSFCIQFS